MSMISKFREDRQAHSPAMKAAKRVGSLPSSLFRAAFSMSQRPRGTCAEMGLHDLLAAAFPRDGMNCITSAKVAMLCKVGSAQV